MKKTCEVFICFLAKLIVFQSFLGGVRNTQFVISLKVSSLYFEFPLTRVKKKIPFGEK